MWYCWAVYMCDRFSQVYQPNCLWKLLALKQVGKELLISEKVLKYQLKNSMSKVALRPNKMIAGTSYDAHCGPTQSKANLFEMF